MVACCTHCLLLTGSGAWTMSPNLQPLGASLATLTVPFFSFIAPIRFCGDGRERRGEREEQGGKREGESRKRTRILSLNKLELQYICAAKARDPLCSVALSKFLPPFFRPLSSFPFVSQTHPQRLSLRQVHLPLVLCVVVDQEPRVEHEETVLESFVQRPLLHECSLLVGLREFESERSSSWSAGHFARLRALRCYLVGWKKLKGPSNCQLDKLYSRLL